VIDSVAAIPAPHEWILNKSLMADLYPSFAQGLKPFFTLNWGVYSDFLTFNGGLNPVKPVGCGYRIRLTTTWRWRCCSLWPVTCTARTGALATA
jgi:hypothetical protein